MAVKKIGFLVFVLVVITLTSCKKDEEISCTTCSSPQTPAFEVCELGNGNAAVNGQNTGTPYNVYIEGLVEAGAQCGQ
tara:strand:- start:155 stop:388 length:234 start_codon:yes stop_codon:yes gene_type:complete